jgi:hypothetical protein
LVERSPNRRIQAVLQCPLYGALKSGQVLLLAITKAGQFRSRIVAR